MSANFTRPYCVAKEAWIFVDNIMVSRYIFISEKLHKSYRSSCRQIFPPCHICLHLECSMNHNCRSQGDVRLVITNRYHVPMGTNHRNAFAQSETNNLISEARLTEQISGAFLTTYHVLEEGMAILLPILLLGWNFTAMPISNDAINTWLHSVVSCGCIYSLTFPDSQVHGANMGPVRTQVGPMLASWTLLSGFASNRGLPRVTYRILKYK